MDHASIYAHHADAYDTLIQAEDTDNNLLQTLAGLMALENVSVLDVGAGTGRFSRLLAPYARRILAVDPSEPMIAVARTHLSNSPHITLRVADASKIPCASGFADLAVAGWVFGHLRHWMPEGWKNEISKCLAEMQRATRHGGWIVLVETLGTGSTQPGAPNASLAEYYAWLEDREGFTRQEIRTDYLFDSVEESARVTSFFFGEAFGQKVRDKGWKRVPECTGVWSRRARAITVSE